MTTERRPTDAMSMSALHADDATARRAAIDALPDSDVAAYALRTAMLQDRDATVRAAAATRLCAMRQLDRDTARARHTWLIDACRDTHVSVREAAYAGLARSFRRLSRADDEPGCAILARACAREPMWTARRAAVIALAAALGERALDALLAALDDPFWRVRNAAIGAIARLGADDPELRRRVTRCAPTSDAARAAVEYLRRGWAGQVDAPLEPAPRPEPVRRADASVDPVWDPDPAVMTARLEDPATEASAALLLEAIADSHETLRKQAARRLARSGDTRAYRAALMWLDEPRIPNAARAVWQLLNQLGDPARELASEVLERGPDERAGGFGPGAQAWAIAWVAHTECFGLVPMIAAFAGSSSSDVRAQVADALARVARAWTPDALCSKIAPDALLDHVIDLLGDPSDDVRLAAARALAEDRSARAPYAALAALPYADQPTLLRRVLVDAFARARDVDRLCGALGDRDAWCRGRAIGALSGCDALTAQARAEAAAHPDPWLRIAALDRRAALSALGMDDQPEDRDLSVQRAAVRWLCEYEDDPAVRLRAGVHCHTSPDRYIRTRASRLLDPTATGFSPKNLTALLALSADSELMVRAAAADPLSATPELDRRLRALLTARVSLTPTIRKSAYTWLAREMDDDAGQLVARAVQRGDEPAEVAAHLRATLHAFPDIAADAGVVLSPPARRVAAVRAPQPAPAPRAVATRTLGQTGIEVAPLALSGVHELSASALRDAWQAGVNLMLWEPRYQAMTRFIRASAERRARLVIAAGTFHASPAAIEADVERALARLRTDYLDILLLFWVRSPARLSREAWDVMTRLKRSGKVRAIGFSSHDRPLVGAALTRRPWDVVMVRHSAAHTGAERDVFPIARQTGAGVLTFSALCYGRMLRAIPGAGESVAPSAAACYRYSLTQPGVTACISAPRRHGELIHNLAVLDAPTLDSATASAVRAHGQRVYARNRDFNALVRREPKAMPGEAMLDALMDALDVAPPTHF